MGHGAESGNKTLNRTKRGFTLLEVMVAVAILAMVLVTLMGVQNRSTQDVMLGTTLRLRRCSQSRRCMRLRDCGNKNDRREGGRRRILRMSSRALRKQSISQVQLAENIKITEVRLAVLWKEGERQEMVELLSYE
jgi:prepilin-type N-terminal cleavage/methylation domain-containing protein